MPSKGYVAERDFFIKGFAVILIYHCAAVACFFTEQREQLYTQSRVLRIWLLNISLNTNENGAYMIIGGS
jgi:hypothetical protein